MNLLALLDLAIDTIAKGKALICDGLESGLSKSLDHGLVRSFVYDADTSWFAQLVFTTHETRLLDLDLSRRNQVGFAKLKEEERTTGLNSLLR